MTFIFGGDTGMTYEQLQRQRAMANQLMAPRPARNAGEGIASFASQISGALMNRRLDRRDTELQQQGTDLFNQAMGGGGQLASAPLPSAPTVPATYGTAPADSSTDPFVQQINASLSRTESGGDTTARNAEGYTGEYQWGDARLTDYNRANGTDYTLDQLHGDPGIQQRAQDWHVNDIMTRAEADGLLGYVGQEINGVPVTPGGIVAAAHLGGYGGMSQMLNSGGEHNPADSNGTSLLDYMGAHAMGGQQGQPAPQATDAQSSPNLQAIMQALSNPYVQQNPGQMAVLQALMGQAMERPETMTPYQQAQLGIAQSAETRAQAQFDRDMNAAPERERVQDANGRWRFVDDGALVFGDVEVAPGFRQLTPDEVAERGLSPESAYQVGSDGRVSTIGGGGTSVTVNNNGPDAPAPGDEKFAEATASQLATTFGTLQEQSLAANGNLAQISQLEALLEEGVGGGMDNFLSAAQRSLGLPISSEPVEAFNAIIAQLVPGQRVPGSGTMSDRDLELFKESLPRLINTPGGNRRILSAMRGMAEYQREQGRIANLAMTGQISRQDAVAQLQAIPNPLADIGSADGQEMAPPVNDSDASDEDLLRMYGG